MQKKKEDREKKNEILAEFLLKDTHKKFPD